MSAVRLTQDEFDELQANALTVDALGKPSFISRHHWRGVTGRLARRGLITWKDHPEFSSRHFAGIEPTTKGREALAAAIAAGMKMSEPPSEDYDE